VTGRIGDIGQNVLPSSFQTGSLFSPSYLQLVFLIAILEEAFIRNIIITPFIDYTI
jgi:membrane protease YdiL (CAAX protease family)